jgi:hypothetical protein
MTNHFLFRAVSYSPTEPLLTRTLSLPTCNLQGWYRHSIPWIALPPLVTILLPRTARYWDVGGEREQCIRARLPLSLSDPSRTELSYMLAPTEQL